MYSEHIKDVLRIARTKDDIDCILLNLEDFYDLLDSGTFQRIDPVTMKSHQKLGLYGHIDGFAIYCSKKCPVGQFALAKNTGLDIVPNIQDLKWTDYASYFPKHQFPKICQRYSLISSPNCIVEIVDIKYNDSRYIYLLDVQIVQIPEQYPWNNKIGDIVHLESLDKYQYLSGQDKPIV